MRTSTLLVAAAMASLVFSGCLADDPLSGDETGTDGSPWAGLPTTLGSAYEGAHPAYGFPTYGFDDEAHPAWNDAWQLPAKRALPAELGRFEHVATTGAQGGAGIAVFGHYAFVGATGGPLEVIDIADPASPVIVATLDVPMRDAETIAYPNGSLLLVSTDGSTIALTDVTDPTNPVFISDLGVTNGAHNVAVLPGTPLYYNSPSGGTITDIWDLSDPTDPILVQQWENGAGCHDIMWHIDVANETYRGYCAGLGETQIWDVANPLQPTVLTTIGLPESTPISISHLAMVNHDAKVLIVGDETGGGAAPACDYYAEVPVTGQTESGPSGNLWFYDLTDEANPVYMSRLSVAAFQSHATCTSHFGRIIEETNHLVMAYYGAGVIMVDFNDLENPRIVDQWRPVSTEAAPPGITWDAWYYEGYVFTGDITRGMDVLQISAPLL